MTSLAPDKAVAVLAALLSAAIFTAVLSGQTTGPTAAGDKSATAPADDADSIMEATPKQLPPGYQSRFDARRNIVYISALDVKTLGLVMRLLGKYCDAQQDLLFSQPLRHNVTVILPTLRDYRRMIPEAKAHGFYDRGTRKLVSISLSNVLVHEFTHALHHNDQVLAGQEHPIWIVEGLAMLFQSSHLKDGNLEVLLDAGLAELQAAIKQGQAYSLADLCSMKRSAFMRHADLCYSQSRYLMLWLYRHDKLRQFYQTYKADYASDPTGRDALEKTMSKTLEQIEADWKRWTLALEAPWQPAFKRRGHLGIRMKQTPEGVLVTALGRYLSSSRTSMLRVGDVIITLGGSSIRTPQQLTAAVRSCKPGQIVSIEVIRDGRTTLIQQLLGQGPPNRRSDQPP